MQIALANKAPSLSGILLKYEDPTTPSPFFVCRRTMLLLLMIYPKYEIPIISKGRAKREIMIY